MATCRCALLLGEHDLFARTVATDFLLCMALRPCSWDVEWTPDAAAMPSGQEAITSTLMVVHVATMAQTCKRSHICNTLKS